MCLFSGEKSDDMSSFIDMENKLYFYSTKYSSLNFKIRTYYEVSAKLKYISPDTIYMSDIRVYATESNIIERLFKIKTILDD